MIQLYTAGIDQERSGIGCCVAVDWGQAGVSSGEPAPATGER